MRQGIVMEIQANTATVFTSDLNMITVAAGRNMFVGQSIELPEAAAAVSAAVPAPTPGSSAWPGMARSRRRHRWLIPAAAAACALFLLFSGFLYAFVILPRPGPVYLSLDINPSVEFVLGADRTVTDVIPMNSDAWAVLSKNDFRGLNVEQAIARWVSLTRQNMPGGVDQLLVSAILTRRDREFADRIMALDSTRGNRESRSLAGLDTLPVKVVYTMDADVKEKADANGLSFGRQMLLDKALSNAPEIDPESIRSAPLKPLVDLLLQDGGSPGPSAVLGVIGGKGQTATTASAPTTKSGEDAVPAPTKPVPTPTSAESAATKPAEPTTTKPTEPTTQPTASAPTTIATTAKPTTKATTAATTAKPSTTATASGPQLQVTGNGSDGWRLQWTPAASGRNLYYYKVVISQSVSQPKYPDNGYLYALSREENSCQAANGSAYNSGDFGGYLVPGQAYYVGITYVYADGKAYSNVLRLTYNGPASPKATTATTTTATSAFAPKISGSSQTDGFTLSWDRAPAGRAFNYYKVVISKGNSAPAYPGDGYLYALSVDENSCRADNSSAYNSGDFGGWLTPGQTYYVRITYVFGDGSKVNSNVLQLTYKGPAHG